MSSSKAPAIVTQKTRKAKKLESNGYIQQQYDLPDSESGGMNIGHDTMNHLAKVHTKSENYTQRSVKIEPEFLKKGSTGPVPS